MIRDYLQQLAHQIFAKIKVKNSQFARLICEIIPANCPFERDFVFFGHKLFHIPAICKFNPVYEQLMDLRFRSLVFLADRCDEDVTIYCH